jgi:hypothetical protein
VAGQCNRTLFLLVQARALRRAALLALEREHLWLIPGGLTITEPGCRTRGPLSSLSLLLAAIAPGQRDILPLESGGAARAVY